MAKDKSHKRPRAADRVRDGIWEDWKREQLGAVPLRLRKRAKKLLDSVHHDTAGKRFREIGKEFRKLVGRDWS